MAGNLVQDPKIEKCSYFVLTTVEVATFYCRIRPFSRFFWRWFPVFLVQILCEILPVLDLAPVRTSPAVPYKLEPSYKGTLRSFEMWSFKWAYVAAQSGQRCGSLSEVFSNARRLSCHACIIRNISMLYCYIYWRTLKTQRLIQCKFLPDDHILQISVNETDKSDQLACIRCKKSKRFGTRWKNKNKINARYCVSERRRLWRACASPKLSLFAYVMTSKCTFHTSWLIDYIITF